MEKTKELEKYLIGENGIGYTLGKDGLYYPDLKLPEEGQYNIGKYGLMRWEYLKTCRRWEYIRMLLAGELHRHLHEVDEECHERIELLAGQMRTSAGITEELKSTDFMQWIGLVNNVRDAAEEIVLKELVYV